MPSFYFEQLLRTGLNGIDQQGITAAVLQIAGVILILSLLWAVYEAYSNGGDVRLLGVAAVKYLVLGLVFLNYQSAFRAVNTMFNGVADGIYNLSGGMDVIQAWGNSLSKRGAQTQLVFRALELVTGGVSALSLGITLVGYLLLPFTYTLFTLFYALYGSILYVVGPFVLALMPSRGFGQLGRSFFVNMMIFQCWGLLYAILQSLMSALQITDPMQFNRRLLERLCWFQPDDRDERGQRAALDHDRPDSVYRQPYRAWRYRQHPDDGGQRSRHRGSRGVRVGVRWRRGLGWRTNARP